MRIPRFLTPLLLFAFLCGYARSEQVYYVNDFLNNGGGARPMALGEAMAADLGDRSAGLYNPCGILGIPARSVLLSHASLFKGMSDYTVASAIVPLGKGRAAGAWLVRSAVDEIWDTRGFETDDEGRPIYSSERLRFVDNVDYAAGFTYAAVFRERLRYGLTLKFIRRRLDQLTSFGTAVDGGVQYLMPYGVTAGLTARNITTSLNRYHEDDWEIGRPEFYPGVGFSRELEYLYGGITLLYQFPDLFSNAGVSQGPVGGSFDAATEAPSDYSLSEDPAKYILGGNIGFEYHYGKRLFLRLGANPQYVFTAGAGLNIRQLNVDIAFRHHLELNDSYRLALSWDF